MRVSDSTRVLFVHVQKTGGSTVDHMFDTEVADARRVGGLRRHTSYRRLLRREPELEEYWSFAFVRNPWARMVSWHSMIQAVFEREAAGHAPTLAQLERHPKVWESHRPYAGDFDKFVLEATEVEPRIKRTQLETVRIRDGRQVDFIGRTENFVHDLNVAREKLRLAALDDPPRRNRSSHGHYSEYYNDVTRRRVAEVYAVDIEAFGYEFEDRR